LYIARGKNPIFGHVIAQSSDQLIDFLRCHLVDVPAQLVHVLNFTQKRSAIVVVLFHDFAFDVAIFLASHIIDGRANFLGRQQHVAASDAVVQGRLDRELPHRWSKYHDRLPLCRGRNRTHAGDCCKFCSTQSGPHRDCRPAAVALLVARIKFPIVFAILTDPVGENFVSFAQPGGNVTELSMGAADLKKEAPSKSQKTLSHRSQRRWSFM
jgi:hypothetical protein